MARKVGTRRGDTLNGTETRDILLGRAGDDMLYGYAGNDDLFGEDGDDTLSGGSGTNRLDGGDGFDTADYSDATAGVFVNFTDGTGIAADRSDTLIAIERVVGSAFDDTFAGSAADETFEGRGGRNTFYSSGGDNVFIGGDAAVGTAAYDIISYFFASEAVTIDLRIAGPQANGFGGVDTLESIEGVGGSGFDDVLIGDAGINLFFGSGGLDRFDGGEGYDELIYAFTNVVAAGGGIVADFRRGVVTGAGGGDTFVNIEKVTGTTTADTFIGDGRANVFQGIDGGDTFTLGRGADLLFYVSTADSNSDTGIDRITDLAREDRIFLSFMDADTNAAGDQAFQVVRRFTGAAGELTVKYDAETNLTTIAGDVNGDGGADLTIFCDGNVTRFVDNWVL